MSKGIRILLIEKGLTQTAIARRHRVSLQRLNNAVRGESLSLKILEILAKELNLSTEEIERMIRSEHRLNHKVRRYKK